MHSLTLTMPSNLHVHCHQVKEIMLHLTKLYAETFSYSLSISPIIIIVLSIGMQALTLVSVYSFIFHFDPVKTTYQL